ncbi:CPBP family intramembrane metalloprotease domain-containing protein, partial [Achromobacter xylosoxidans]|uniref:CPBP family intramembrane metalloprotease domain-containing protein n=1 Tax=Alcaligenes xylosoxydans xylosoxydans TaxID=85698 RepID=UPI00204247E3
MPFASPGTLMFLAAAMLWPAATRRWAPLPLALAYAWACTQGGIDPVALAWPALLLLAALLVRPAAPGAASAAGHTLFVILAVLLFLHWLPGFHNPLVIPRAALTPDAVPFGMYLNLDKPLVAFWVVLAAAPAMAGAGARATLLAALAARAAPVVGCLGLGLALVVVGMAPKMPHTGWLWLAKKPHLVTQ